MSFLSNITKGVIAGTLATVVSVSAYAAPILTASIVPNPTASNLPFSLLSLGTAPGAGVVAQNFAGLAIDTGITATATGNSGIFVGDASGTRSPYRAANGTATNETYFNAQANSGSIVLNFTTGQSYVNLLWGSVDNNPVNYNQLSITFSGPSSNYIVNGADIVTAAGGAPPVVTGTTNIAVQISNLDPFTTATFTATRQAFEFALGGPTTVPEPASLALFGAGLLGLGLARRARRKAA